MTNVTQPVGVLTYQGSPTALVSLLDATYSGTSVTLNFGKNQFRRLVVAMDWNGGGIASVALTGLSAATYAYSLVAANNATPAGAVANAASNWALATNASASAGEGLIGIDLLPAPSKKAMQVQESDAFVGTGPIGRWYNGYSTDTTNDPTALVITMDASRSGRIKVWGMQ